MEDGKLVKGTSPSKRWLLFDVFPRMPFGKAEKEGRWLNDVLSSKTKFVIKHGISPFIHPGLGIWKSLQFPAQLNVKRPDGFKVARSESSDVQPNLNTRSIKPSRCRVLHITHLTSSKWGYGLLLHSVLSREPRSKPVCIPKELP